MAKGDIDIMYLRVKGTAIREMLGAVPLNQDLYRKFVLERAQVEDDTLAAELQAARMKLESQSVKEVEQEGMTGFLKINGVNHFSGHIVAGMIKEVMYTLRAANVKAAKRVTAYRKKADLCIRVLEPVFPLILPETVCVPVWDFGVPNMDWEPLPDSEKWDKFHARIMNGEELFLPADKIDEYERYMEHLKGKTRRKIKGYTVKKAKMGVCTRPLRAETAQGPRVALAASETVPPGTTFQFHMVVLGDYANTDLLDKVFATLITRGMAQWRSSGKGTVKIEYEVLDQPPRAEDVYWAESFPSKYKDIGQIVQAQIESMELLGKA